LATRDPEAGLSVAAGAAKRFADKSRARFLARQARLEREQQERDLRDAERRKAIAVDPVAAALARARARRRPGE
jgi:Na+-translocating ferredoxin:NAD+ oxidoreductase RnfC subunit